MIEKGLRHDPRQLYGEPGPKFGAINLGVTDHSKRPAGEPATQIAIALFADPAELFPAPTLAHRDGACRLAVSPYLTGITIGCPFSAIKKSIAFARSVVLNAQKKQLRETEKKNAPVAHRRPK